MLAASKLQTIVLSSRLAEAEKFYGEVLGLQLKGKSHGAKVAWFRDPDGNLLSIVQYAKTPDEPGGAR